LRAYVIDASTAIKWYIPEPLSKQATYFLDLAVEGQAALMAPDLVLPEIGNVLWKKVKRNELSEDEALAIVYAIAKEPPMRIVPSSTLLPGAMEIAVAYSRTVYDCLYVALAASESAVLITADERLANSMQNSVYADRIKYLGDA